MIWANFPSDPHAGENWPDREREKELELENQHLALQVEVYEEVLDFYGHLKEAHISLSHRMREEEGE